MNDDLISRQGAIDDIETVNPSMPLSINWVKNWVKTLPSAQPELIEQGAYVRGFEQGRTQGMIDNTIKAEWTNADALDLQQTCNQLATDCISRQAAIDDIKAMYEWHDVVTEDRLIEHMKRLPSAQPEIIRCGECRHYRTADIFGKKLTMCKRREYDSVYTEPDDFCSYAERKENG